VATKPDYLLFLRCSAASAKPSNMATDYSSDLPIFPAGVVDYELVETISESRPG
jgi:hypothetical protein